MKICKECGIKKPLAEYYVHKAMADGHLNKCKLCVRSRVAKYAEDHSDYYKSYEQKRAMLPQRVEARKRYAKTEQGKQAIQRAQKKYKQNYPMRDFARNAVNNALRDGKIQKLPCFICGEIAEAHHPDYSRPLDVMWLCNSHHREVHALKF